MAFHSPWWLWLGLAGLGLFLIYNGNQRSERRLILVGVIALVASLSMELVNYLVVTDTERCESLSRQVVAQAVAQHWDAVSALMNPDTSFEVMGEPRDGLFDRAQILQTLQRQIPRYGVTAANITSTDASQQDSLVEITLSIQTVQDATLGRPIPSTWQFQWTRTTDSWTLQRIVLLTIGGRDGSEIYSPLR
jgi:hypothetical protein